MTPTRAHQPIVKSEARSDLDVVGEPRVPVAGACRLAASAGSCVVVGKEALDAPIVDQPADMR